VFTGGLRKDIWSDLIQLGFIVVGMAFVLPRVMDIPARETLRQVDRDMWTVGPYGPVFLVGAVLAIAPMLVVRPDLWQRVRAAKSQRIAKWSFVAAGPVIALTYCFFTYVGLLAQGLKVKPDVNLLLAVVTEKGQGDSLDWVSAVVMVAFVGAVISSFDSLLNVSGIALVRGIRPARGEEESKTPLTSLRIATVVIVILAAGLALGTGDIVNVFVAAVSFVMVLAPPVLHILLGGVPHRTGSFWSVVAGVVVLVPVLFWAPKVAFVPAVLTGWAVYGSAIVLRSRRKPLWREAGQQN